MSAITPETKQYRIWVEHCPFRKNGTPVLGTFGATAQPVVVLTLATWQRLCADSGLSEQRWCVACQYRRYVTALLAHLAHYQAQAEALRETFAAGYHCQWDRDRNCYIFDPQLKPGDPDGAFEAWSRHTKT